MHSHKHTTAQPTQSNSIASWGVSSRNYTRILKQRQARNAAPRPTTAPTFKRIDDGHQKMDASKKARLAAPMDDARIYSQEVRAVA